MRYDRDYRARGPRGRWGFAGRGEHGESYEGPFDRGDFGEGFEGDAPGSRGGWSGGMRGYDPGAEFGRGDGYAGGRGYGGTNYDVDRGSYTGGRGFGSRSRGAAFRQGEWESSPPESRGGHASEPAEEYGPARYGYGPYYHRLRQRRRPDRELREEIEETLFFDTWVDAEAITVMVEDGVVTLRGTLPSYEELRYAVDDAWDVDGVRGVRSELLVDEERGTTREREDVGRGLPGRYVAGAPHMHGHPEVAPVARHSERSEVSRGEARGANAAARPEPDDAIARDSGAAGGDGSPGLTPG